MNIFSLLNRALLISGKLHLRGMIFILGLALVLNSWHPWFVKRLDAWIFKTSTLLMEAPKGATGILIVEVPQKDMDTWQSDINQAGQLGALLSNILHSSNTLVGLVLDYPIDARTASADSLLDEIAKLPKSENESLAKAREMSQRKSFLLEFLRNPRVVVGVYDRRFPGLTPYGQDWGKLNLLPEFVRRWLWSNEDYDAVPLPGSLVDHHPIYRSPDNERVLIVEANGSEANAGFILHLLDADQSLKGVEQQDFIWHRDGRLKVGSLELSLSPSGAVLPVFGATARMTPLIERISLEEALARGAFPQRVYISTENSELASTIAMTTYSLEQERSAHSPWWYKPFEKIFLVLLTCYLVFVLPKLNASTGMVLSTFFIVLMLIAQIVAQATQKLWLPLSLSMTWLLCGHLLIVIWQRRRAQWQALVERADDACVDQTRYLIERGDLSDARSLLQPCETQMRVLAAMYELSGAFASKRNYKQAIEVLEDLEKRKRNYRDVREKIAALKSMLATSEKPRDIMTPMESTVVLDASQVDKPILGRYQIQEELGRGAMGTVFLAYDPKISRQVAIKTLSYHQFQGKELEDIKSRFFREAEAAGRLSHPNIVSVFDVGEEHDMAFIAMDFADGKPLNEFVTKEALLPMFEVYRIVADVALALEYAHNNNIVHRDIKPGNIMYNPSPYQLKVTDFGIARLVDNSKTSTGEILGSPLYMAPEQLKGKKVNHLADIFSLGVTFYQLLTGKLPFQGENLASLTYEIIHGKHKSPKTVRKDLPSSAARIVNQALQKDPDDRYTSAADMAMVIKKAIKRDFAQEAKRAGII